MSARKTVPVSAILFCICFLWGGEPPDPSRLTLEKIFTKEAYQKESFGPARWLENGSGYTTLEMVDAEDEDQGHHIVRYDPATGAREILIRADRLVPPGASSPLKIDDYNWSSDGKSLLIFTDSERVWRRNTRGDYWLADLSGDGLRRLGGEAEPSSLMFAKFSPAGDRIAYVYKNDIYVQDIKDMAITRLTSDGSDTIINGTFDWVYEEEFSLRDGYRWSPDGKHIAYWQLDSSGVGDFFLINNTDSLYPRITAIPYPKAGETNSACRVGVVPTRGGATTWIKTQGDPRNHYIAHMEWADGPDEIVFQYLNRQQNTNTVFLADIRSGVPRGIFTDRDDTWVEVNNDFKWLKRGQWFTWISERSGWRHLYSISRSGDRVRPVTRGNFDVINIESIDTRSGWIYYIASPHNPCQRYLYRMTLNGRGSPERLSPLEQPGTHSYDISPDSKWAFHTYSSFTTPPTISLIRLPSHQPVRTLAQNRDLKKKIAALKLGRPEFFRTDIDDDIQFDCWLIRPPDFNDAKKYPVLFYVYGEPWGQTVLDRWGGDSHLWHHMLAQRGYLVMSVDNRGTSAPRGREWRKSIYGQIGILASADQAAAARAIIKKLPFVDPSRVGIWGWSGGGSMSLNAIFRYPEIYHTAMAVAFVSNQRFYDSIYQERYMGLPKDNPDGYKNGSPITHAHRLRGNLLLVHGTGDDNVHYQSCEALVNELIKHNKHFTMMAYPNRSHGIHEGENTSRHLFELLTRYLREHLPPGGR